MGLTEQALLAFCASEGVTVRESSQVPGMGKYVHATRTIWLNTRLSTRERTPVLLHEVLHMQAGHVGPQPPAIERKIRRDVARILIKQTDYARAKRIGGGNLYTIAEELDQPAWLVRDYRTVLEGRLLGRPGCRIA